MRMKTVFPQMASWAAAILVVVLGGCGRFSKTISIDRETIQKSVEGYFPMSSDDAEGRKKPIRVTLTDPETLLEEGSDQLGLRLTIIAEPTDENAPPIATPPSGPPIAAPPPVGPPGGKLPVPEIGSDEPNSQATTVDERPQVFEGTVGILGQIAYKPEEASFYYLKPKISELNFPQLPPQFETPVRTAVEVLLAKYLEEHSIYTLSDDDLKSRAAKSALKSVAVKDGKLNIEIGW
jgi:hypothetical protein